MIPNLIQAVLCRVTHHTPGRRTPDPDLAREVEPRRVPEELCLIGGVPLIGDGLSRDPSPGHLPGMERAKESKEVGAQLGQFPDPLRRLAETSNGIQCRPVPLDAVERIPVIRDRGRRHDEVVVEIVIR